MSDIIGKYENCFKENRNLPALTDFLSGKTYTYFQLAAKIENNHRTFRENGIQKGDKIALIGKNSIDWICTYISVITFGATIVPILPDFNPKDVVGIINHSDSKILFADKSLLEKLSVSDMTGIQKIFCIGGTSHTLFVKYLTPVCGVIPVKLPSTSPANAAWTFEKLLTEWSVITRKGKE